MKAHSLSCKVFTILNDYLFIKSNIIDKSYSFIVIILSILLLGMPNCMAAFPSCTWGCTSGDITSAAPYLGDANGNPITGCVDCSATQNVYLWITLDNRAADRYQAYIIYDISIQGSWVTKSSCLDEAIDANHNIVYLNGLLPGGSTTYKLATLPCGGYQLQNIVVTWVTHEKDKDCPTPNANGPVSCNCPTVNCDDRNGAQCEKFPKLDVDAPPSCDFYIKPSNPVCDGTTVSFDGPSGMTTYSWTFGDGGTANIEDPTHLYTAPGSYSVSLTVVKGTCPPKTCSQTVTVQAKPTANAGPDQTVCVNVIADLIGSGTNYLASSALWTKDSGAGTLTQSSTDLTKATYKSATPEEAILRFTVTGNSPCGTTTATDTVKVTVIPIPNNDITVLVPT
jgi:PKD repeat protein